MTEPLNSPFVYQQRVAFVDTDMAGIVHFSNFFRYMEAAEDAFLQHLGIKLVGTAEGRPMSFPRLSVQASYISPLHYGDVVEVEVQLMELGEKKIRYAFLMQSNSRVVARGEILTICCEMNPLRSIPIPTSMHEKLATYRLGTSSSGG